MKKILIVAIMLLMVKTCFAAEINHTNTRANISVTTTDFWQKIQTKQTTIKKIPAYQIDFVSLTPTTDKLALMIIDGKNNESFTQTAKDFKSGNAKLILLQITDQEKQAPKGGFKLIESEVKKAPKTDYIYLKYQNDQIIRYNIMTMLGEYNITINCQTNAQNQQQAEQNLALMMQTLSLVKG